MEGGTGGFAPWRKDGRARRRTDEGRPLRGMLAARRQMSLPTRVRSRAKVRLRVSCFLAGSFPGARFGKYPQKFREVLDLQMHGQQLRILAFRAFVPAAPRRLAFSLRASADPDSPRL